MLKKSTESTARRYSILIYSYMPCSRFLQNDEFCSRFFCNMMYLLNIFHVFVLAIKPTFSSVSLVNNKRSTMSSRKFQGWNSRVPLVEFQSSTGGSREFHWWNSTSRLQIISTQIREGSKKTFPGSWSRDNTFLAALRLNGSKNRNKSTANRIYFEKSTAMYIDEIEHVTMTFSKFS